MKKTLFDQLLDLHNNHLEVIGNNYTQNRLELTIYPGRLEISSFCRNEYNSVYGNNDKSIIRWEDITPNKIYNQIMKSYCKIRHFENETVWTCIEEGENSLFEDLPF